MRLRADRSVVTPLHLQILQIIAQAEQAYGSLDLRLEGGTALAAYFLKHRQSEDLDLFGSPMMDARDFRSFVGERARERGLNVVREGRGNPGFAESFLSDLPAPAGEEWHQVIRVEFARSSPFVLEPPLPTYEGVRVASYRDLTAGKLHALCDRYEPKDFIDLHAILHYHLPDEPPPGEEERRRRFRTLVADLSRSDPGLSAVQIGDALARGEGRPILSEFPLRLLVTLGEQEVQATIRLALDECAGMIAAPMRQEREPQREQQPPAEAEG